MAVILGTVQSSFNDKGFTFIDPDADSGVEGTVFLHITALSEGEDAKAYVRGSRVQFEVALVLRNGAEKAQAREVHLMPSSQPSATRELAATSRQGQLKFWSPQAYGFLVDEETGTEYYVNAKSVPGGYLRHGDEVQFDVERGWDDKLEAVNVALTGWQPTGETFSDTLDFGHPRWAMQLEAHAEPEKWNYQQKPSRDPHVILRSYIKYTFLRLNELPNHVVTSSDGLACAFNTGLVTTFQEQIFAVFRRRSQGESGPPWVLRGFEKASSVTFLRLFGGHIPPLAWYYDAPEQLVFNTALPLNVNVEHVPHDPDRFPAALSSLSPQDLAGLVNAKAPEAVERVRRNYKTAIPQYYRDGKSGEAKMQLLLPVALLRRDNVELALAVDRLSSNVYLGRTVLTLDWAYNNARLLTRPDTDWLRP